MAGFLSKLFPSEASGTIEIEGQLDLSTSSFLIPLTLQEHGMVCVCVFACTCARTCIPRALCLEGTEWEAVWERLCLSVWVSPCLITLNLHLTCFPCFLQDHSVFRLFIVLSFLPLSEYEPSTGHHGCFH